MGTRANDIASLIRTGTQLDSDAIGTGAITAAKLNAGLVDLSDTNMTGISEGELLKYDSATSKYVPTSMVEDSSGKVGIGTSSPSFNLEVKGDNLGSTSGDKVDVFMLRSNLPSNADMLNFTKIREANGSDWSSAGWRIQHQVDFTDMAYLQFNGSGLSQGLSLGTANSERMRINSAGEVLIGYTSDNGNYKLQVNSQIFATSNSIATSDQRYKENVIPLTGAIDTVKALNPVQFDWKEHPVHEFDRSAPTTGFIAQEVQTALADKPWLNSLIKSNDVVIEPKQTDENGNVIAEAVTEEFLGIAEGNLIAVLTKAIQEQQTQIEAQQATIEALEARLTALEGGA